jgi:hypothetical protein
MSENKVKVVKDGGPFGFFMLLSFVGALVYFVGNVDGFWNIILAILKAFIWPAFLVHRALELMAV